MIAARHRTPYILTSGYLSGYGRGTKNARLPVWQTGGVREASSACLGACNCPTAAGLAQDLSPAPILRFRHRVAGYPANGGTCRTGYRPCVLRETQAARIS